MDTERVIPHQTVLIERGRITAIGPVRQLALPAGTTRIDGRGRFLLPGLADMHAHVFPGPHIGSIGLPLDAPTADSAGGETRLILWLANGATTVRELDFYQEDWGRWSLQLRARAAAGREWFPRIYSAGEWGPKQYINIDPDFSHKVPPVLDSIAAYIATYKAAGYDLIKVHEETPIVLDSVLAAAHRIGIPVVGHVPPPTHMEHVIPLYRSIEHPLTTYFSDKHDSWPWHDTAGLGVVVAEMHRSGTWNCPTQAHFDKWHDRNVPNVLKVEQDSGVGLLLGTDETPWRGVLTRELQAMVEAGLTPYQALLTGTRNVAAYFGTLADGGTIAVGKRADLLLLTGNPLRDVRYTAQPAGVMLGGRWLSRAVIDKRVATLRLPTFNPPELVFIQNGSPSPWGKVNPLILPDSAPVKSYWQNVIDEAMAGTTRLLGIPGSNALTADQQTSFKQLQAKHEEQRKALVTALGESDHYTDGTRRILRLVAQQLGEDRLVLTSRQRAIFDKNAGAWVRRYEAKGDTVKIPGL